MFGANLENLTELGQQEIEVGSSLTPMSDQDIISPCNINTLSHKQVMRITKKISIRGSLVDPIPNSLKLTS